MGDPDIPPQSMEGPGIISASFRSMLRHFWRPPLTSGSMDVYASEHTGLPELEGNTKMLTRPRLLPRLRWWVATYFLPSMLLWGPCGCFQDAPGTARCPLNGA